MSALWTLGDLADAMGGTLQGAAPATPVTGVSIDTRTLQPGDVFFAIQGVSMDGHRFVDNAHGAGAAAVVVSREAAGPSIRVRDVLEGLRRAGTAARARLDPATPVIAITGSVGKTGTKEMLRLAFSAYGRTHASAASYNNHWGVPLSLARMAADTEAAIFEIGMNHAGEITPLTRLVRPRVAIITTVAPVHLEFFDSVEGIADAKAEIFAGLTVDGIATLPVENNHFARLKDAAADAGARIVTFGEGGDVRLAGEGATVFGEPVPLPVDAARPIRTNALAVLAALAVTGRPVRAGAEALAAWSAPKGRGRRVRVPVAGGTAVVIDEAYNANPASMQAAIATLAAERADRRIAIIGDMLELGPTSPELHRSLARWLTEAHTRYVHTVGTMTEHLRDALPEPIRGLHAPDADALIAALPELQPGDACLVKGSNAVGLSAVVAALEAGRA